VASLLKASTRTTSVAAVLTDNGREFCGRLSRIPTSCSSPCTASSIARPRSAHRAQPQGLPAPRPYPCRCSQGSAPATRVSPASPGTSLLRTLTPWTPHELGAPPVGVTRCRFAARRRARRLGSLRCPGGAVGWRRAVSRERRGNVVLAGARFCPTKEEPRSGFATVRGAAPRAGLSTPGSYVAASLAEWVPRSRAAAPPGDGVAPPIDYGAPLCRPLPPLSTLHVCEALRDRLCAASAWIHATRVSCCRWIDLHTKRKVIPKNRLHSMSP